MPMQSIDKSAEEFEQELLFTQDPLTTDAETIQNIVESTYCPADLSKIVAGCNLLSISQQNKLYKLLKKLTHLFDGTLGNWKTNPVDLELKDKNDKPSLIMRNHIQFHTLKNNSSKRNFKELWTLEYYKKETDLNGHALCSRYLNQINR
jgi:hypothetical protein